MEFPVIIKKRQAFVPLYALTSFVMLCISLFFLFLPFIPDFAGAMSDKMLVFYMAAGAMCTLFFSFSFFAVIFSALSPPTGLKLTEKGLYDYTVAGVGAGFIPGDAILSLRTFGNKKGRFLGIKIDPKYIDSLSGNRNVRYETDNNISSGLPAVVIRQSDISVSVSELLQMILEAYSAKNTVERGAGQKEKAASVFFAGEPVQAAEPIALPSEKQPEIKAAEQAQPLPPDGKSSAAAPACAPDGSGKNERDGAKKARIKSVDDLLRQLNIFPDSGRAESKGGGEEDD